MAKEELEPYVIDIHGDYMPNNEWGRIFGTSVYGP